MANCWSSILKAARCCLPSSSSTDNDQINELSSCKRRPSYLISKMKTTAVLVALAGIIGSALAVAIPEIDTGSLPEGSVNVYPNGLPEDLIPRALGLVERDLDRRANAGVFLCTDAHFLGYCVHIIQPHCKFNCFPTYTSESKLADIFFSPVQYASFPSELQHHSSHSEFVSLKQVL